MSSIKSLLAESRSSGPATVYELDPDGVITEVTTRPARGPYTPSKLTPEEVLCILLQTGALPENFPAAIHIGVQATDLGYGIFEIRQSLTRSGIMAGVWAGSETDPNDA